MALIQGANSPFKGLDVDNESGAARVTLYGIDGLPTILPSNMGRGIATVNVRLTTALTMGGVVWAMRCTHATRRLYLARQTVQLAFDGILVGSLMKIEVIKGTGVTAMTGTPVVPLIKSTSIGQTADAEIKTLATGMALTGVVWGGVGVTLGFARQFIQTSPDLGIALALPIELALNEVIAIRFAAVGVIGDTVMGGVEFQNG